MGGRDNPEGGRCKRCRVRLPQAARRCSACGTKVFVSPPVAPEEAAHLELKRLLRRYSLNEIQARILTAADGGEIIVYGDAGSTEGEVKAGAERFYGNDAVAAVARFVGQGLVAPCGDDRFRLTGDGSKLADALAGAPRAEA